MTAGQFLNYAATAFPATVAAAPGASGSIQVQSQPGTWPAPPYKALIDWGSPAQEAVLVTAQSGAGPVTLTCTRGIDNTTAQAHSPTSLVMHGYGSGEFGTLSALQAGVLAVMDPAFGAAGNAQQSGGAAMTSGLATLTCTSHPFTPAAPGMIAVVQGAGVAGADLVTAISGYTNSGSVTLAAPASTTVTNATVTFGTDDTAAIQACWTAAFAGGAGGIYFPPTGGYLTTASLTGTNVGDGMKVFGAGNASQIYGTGNYDVFHFTTGTGLTISDLSFGHALSAPTSGCSISINSIADYRIENVSMGQNGASFQGVGTSGGTSKTSNVSNSYIQGYAIGMYCPGSMTAIGSHIGGGAIGLIWDSGAGHSFRLTRVGLYGPLPLTTRPGGNITNSTQNKTVWIEAVEFNYQTGIANAASYMQGTETPGGANLDWCGGDIHITDPWLTGSGLTIGGALIAPPRADAGCSTTSGSTAVADTGCTSADLGKSVTGAGIPSGATIIAPVTAGSGFTLSAAATATGTATLSIAARTDSGCTITSGSTTILDGACTAADAGSPVTGPGIPAGATATTPITAGTSFTLSAPATSTITGSAYLALGGTQAPIAPNWITIQGGNAGGNSLTMPNGIHVRSGSQISVSNMTLTGASAHTSGASSYTAGGNPSYSSIVLDAAVTGPITINGCVFSGNCYYCIDSAVTSGQVVIDGNAFTGFFGAQAVNYPVTAAGITAHRITGNGGMSDLVPSAFLADASTIAVSASLGSYMSVTLGGNRTMGAPSNPQHGQVITFALKQDATGSRTVTWNAAYGFSVTVPAPTLSTAPGAVDEIAFRYDAIAATWRAQGYSIGFAA